MNQMHPSRLATGAAGVLILIGACAPAPPAELAPTRQAPPSPLQTGPLHFPEFEALRLPNGLELVIIEHGTQPVANVNLFIRSGTAVEEPERAGMAGMLADLLTKGTTERSAEYISQLIESVGGSLSASAGLDWLTVSAAVLTEDLPLAFDLVSDVTRRPTFPPEELELTRRRTLSGLRAALAQPSQVAQRRFIREVYGEHPYGTSPIPGTVEAVRRDDLVRYHQTHVHPGNALLVVSGVFDRNRVEELARQHFGDWQSGAAAVRRLPEPPAREQARIYLVHRPGSVQSVILVGHTAIRPDNPDFFALQVMNAVVGGLPSARLEKVLREDKGWGYFARSTFTRPVDIGHYSATTEVRTEVTDSALIEMLAQLRRIRDEGVPPAELQAAQGFLAGSFPLRLETAGQIASQVAQLRLLGLPIEYVTEYRERIRAVTAQDVQRVAQQYVRPDRAVLVVVGDATQLLPRLEAIAPIVLYDVEGEVIEREAIGGVRE